MARKEERRCSFHDAIRRKDCPYYRAGKSPRDCLGYITEVTVVPKPQAVVHIYHCRYDALGPVQESLF